MLKERIATLESLQYDIEKQNNSEKQNENNTETETENNIPSQQNDTDKQAQTTQPEILFSFSLTMFFSPAHI